MEQNKTVEQYSLLKIIFLSLFPGLIIVLMAIIFSHPAFIFRFPILLSLMLSICFGLVPSELGILFFMAKKDKKKLTDLIKFREKTPLSKFFIWILVSFIIAGIAFGIVSNYEHPLWKIFDWIPDWFRLDKIQIEGSSFLIISVILNLVFNGFIGPFIEEIYFRGFLLPRMEKFGKSAPLINAILFSIYHFFTPYENITRVIAVTPFIYGVWKNKDIRIGIIVHWLCNNVGTIGIIITVIKLYNNI